MTVATYRVPPASGLNGVRMADRVELTYWTVEATSSPAGSRRMKLAAPIEPACIGSLKVARTVAVDATPSVPSSGEVDSTDGA